MAARTRKSTLIKGDPHHDLGKAHALSISPTRLSRYLQAIAGGNYRKVAAKYAGITEPTSRNWVRYAEDHAHTWQEQHPGEEFAEVVMDFLREHPATGTGKGGKASAYAENSPAFTAEPPIDIPHGYWLCILFVFLMERAEAEAEVTALSRVQLAAQDARHWQAAMTFLERRHPDHWGRRDRIEQTGAGGGPIQFEGSVPSAEAIAARIAELVDKRRAEEQE